MNDIRQTKNWARFIGRKGWKFVTLEGGTIALIRPLLFLGSIMKIQRPKQWITDADLVKLKRYRPLFIKIEPQVNIAGTKPTSVNVVKDTWPLIPTKTKIIDLTNSIEDILKKSSKDVRQSVKKSTVSVGFYNGTDEGVDQALKVFSKNYAKVAQIQKFTPQNLKTITSLKDIFQDKFYLFESKQGEQVNAGAIVLCADDKNAFYMNAYSNYESGRKTYAAYKLLFEILKQLKQDGIEKLDLEGLTDDRFKKETSRWLGFTMFKNKWFGEVVTFDVPYIIYFNKFFKFLFTFGTIGENTLDKITNNSKDSLSYQYLESMMKTRKSK